LKNVDNIFTYSLKNSNADVYIQPKAINDDGSIFSIKTNRFFIPKIKTELVGAHILNALAIGVSVLDLFSIEKDNITEIIGKAKDVETRGYYKTVGKFIFFDDTYSSSPEAVISAMERVLLREGGKSVVLGDMLELGSHAEELHALIGRGAAEKGFRRLFAFGKYAGAIADGAIKSGMSSSLIFINPDIDNPEKTANDIIVHCAEGEILLVKASHKIKAQRIIEIIERKTLGQ
jgi:UDP-N-acetylmuramoyl-tripeptide--D-alanyl-D-alanine ligase